MVYIREAHAIDGRSPSRSGEVLVEEPITLMERFGVAQTCMTKMEIEEIPALIDDMDDAVGQAYSGFPDRLYLVGADGTIAFHGERGPRGFQPDLLEEAIQAELGIAAGETEDPASP